MVKGLKKWWGGKTPGAKMATIIAVILAVAMSVAATVMIILSKSGVSFMEESIGAAGAVGAASVGAKIMGTAFYIFVFIGYSMILRGLLFVLFIWADKKVLTIVKLISSAIKYGMGLALIFMILSTWGVPVMAQLAATGILALIIGLGAQSIISDVLAGINIIFENEFNVGDIVYIDNFRGTIQEIGLTTTKIVDWQGNVKIINNSKISTVVNLSVNVTTIVVEVSVEYGENLEALETLIKNNLQLIKDRTPIFKSVPSYLGLVLGDSAVVLKFSVDCEEADRFAAERALNREIYILFQENNINIPFPQVTISNREQ